MKSIKGRISQVIPPDKQKNYMLPWRAMERFLDGKYLVVVQRHDIPNSYPNRLWYEFKHRKEELYYYIITSYSGYIVGSEVELTIEDIMVRSGFYTNETTNSMSLRS